MKKRFLYALFLLDMDILERFWHWFPTKWLVQVSPFLLKSDVTMSFVICMYCHYCQIVTFHCVSVNRWCLAHGHANFVRTSTVSVDAAPAQMESERRYSRKSVLPLKRILFSDEQFRLPTKICCESVTIAV